MNEAKPYHHTGKCSGWSVEARSQGENPVVVGEQTFDNRWRRVTFERVQPPFGVPNGGFLHGRALNECSLYTFYAAQALRYWFHAVCENTPGAFFSMETRLVPHQIQHKVEWQQDGEPAAAKIEDLK